MTLVDSHCHWDDKQFDADREAAIDRARAAGVEAMISIGTGDGPPDLEAGLRLALQYDFMYATVGVHPHNAAQSVPETPHHLRELLRHPKVVALGEIGLDYHYDFSPRDRQREVFTEQIHLAREARKPIVIHTREAWDDTMETLSEHWVPAGLPGVMHCFSGDAEQARQALDMGFFISFAGVVTYPKAVGIHEAAKVVPLDRLLVETDAPYLAPVPRRGKRNESAYIVHTAQRVADLRGDSIETVAEATTANCRRLFGLR
ncbi:MAG: TatD family hydrolase [Bryobacteraceae bacterium]